jgi:hypothetical protein
MDPRYGSAEYFRVCGLLELCCYHVRCLLHRVWKEDAKVDYIAIPTPNQDQDDVGSRCRVERLFFAAVDGTRGYWLG